MLACAAALVAIVGAFVYDSQASPWPAMRAAARDARSAAPSGWRPGAPVERGTERCAVLCAGAEPPVEIITWATAIEPESRCSTLQAYVDLLAHRHVDGSTEDGDPCVWEWQEQRDGTTLLLTAHHYWGGTDPYPGTGIVLTIEVA
jgi:hypothetical protein